MIGQLEILLAVSVARAVSGPVTATLAGVVLELL